MIEQCKFLAERLQTAAPDSTETQVRHAYQMAYCRAPNENEISEAVQFIERQGLVAFCRALLNSNEFLFLS